MEVVIHRIVYTVSHIEKKLQIAMPMFTISGCLLDCANISFARYQLMPQVAVTVSNRKLLYILTAERVAQLQTVK